MLFIHENKIFLWHQFCLTKDKHYNLQLDFREHMRSLTAFVIVAFSRVYARIFKTFQF